MSKKLEHYSLAFYDKDLAMLYISSTEEFKQPENKGWNKILLNLEDNQMVVLTAVPNT